MNVVRSESKTVLLDPSANAEYKNGHPAAMIAAIENESENYFDLVVNCSITEAMEVKADDDIILLEDSPDTTFNIKESLNKVSPLRLKRLDSGEDERRELKNKGDRWSSSKISSTPQTSTGGRESRKDKKICKSTQTEVKLKKPKGDLFLESDFDNLPETFVQEKGSHSTLYDRLGVLGTGGFAKVYMVRERNSGVVYADKLTSFNILNRRSNAVEKIKREIKIHKSLDHANIVQFHSHFTDEKYIHMVMEICTNKTLLHVLRYRTTILEPEARYYLKQIMEGTRYMHLQQVLHRDLKLGNMFIHEDMTIKIGDFGLATTFRGNSTGSMCGTPNYIAPEILVKKGHGIESDIWAIGCMLYAMLCGNPPFETDSLTSTYKKIADVNFSIPSKFNLSKNARGMIKKMLSKEPESRGHLSMTDRYQDEKNDLFQHPFLQEFTPRTLPLSAIKSIPDLEKDKVAAQKETSTRSSAVNISARRETDECIRIGRPASVGYGSLNGGGNSSIGYDSFGRNGGGASVGYGSLSPPPVFSPPNNQQFSSSSIRNRFGAFFEKRGRFIQRMIEALTLIFEQQKSKTGPNGAQLFHTFNLATHGSYQGIMPPPQNVYPQLPVFISKWVDYSNRFGFGYQLSNSGVGIVFQDCTRMGLTPNRKTLEFLDMKGKAFTYPLHGSKPAYSGVKDMAMRVKILENVMDYMENHLADCGASIQGVANVSTTSGRTLVPHVKRWERRGDWIALELNNRTIQINHILHHSKIIGFECSGDLYLTILEPNQTPLTYSLISLLNTNCPSSLMYWLTSALAEIKNLAEKE